MSESEITVDESYKLIVTIVKKGAASRVVAASKNAGAEGGTILLGRGSICAIDYLNILGLSIGIEREIILTFVKEEKAETVLQAIVTEGKLNNPGTGIGLIVNIKGITGIYHLMKIQQ